MAVLLTPLTLILGFLSIFCGMLMYYNMKHAIDMKHIREEFSSMSVLLESEQHEQLSFESELQIKDSVRKLAEAHLEHITKDLELLSKQDRAFDCIGECSHMKRSIKMSTLSASRINYADIFLGAQVETAKYTSPTQHSKFLEWFAMTSSSSKNEQNILHSNMKPGCCFAFKGQEAKLTIRLTKAIKIEFLELQHISKYDSPSKETSSAPRLFSVYGVDADGRLVALGDFEYENLEVFQVFPVAASGIYQKIMLHFRTNHGNMKYTCVYRIAVYGQPKK